jgi:hypothetical protein
VVATSTASDSRRSAEIGAVSSIVAAVAVLPWFFPLGRVFDPTFGGDEPSGLTTELVLGFFGALALSPLCAAIGACVGWKLGLRPLRWARSAAVLLVAAALAFALYVWLNRGLVDESGSTDSVWFVLTLGGLAGLIAVSAYSTCRRVVLQRRSNCDVVT